MSEVEALGTAVILGCWLGVALIWWVSDGH
jgi:hypothetical protein